MREIIESGVETISHARLSFNSKSIEIDTIKFVLGDVSIFAIDGGGNRWKEEEVNLLFRNHV